MVPVISFVIPVRDDAARLARCLDSIVRQCCPGHRIEVLVADNGSTDGSDRVAAAGARVFSLPRLNVAALRNRMATVARARVLAFVDADHEISAGWVLAALETLRHPGVAAAGTPCDPPADATWVQRVYDTFRDHRPAAHDVEWLGAGNLAVSRDVFLALGGFNEDLESCEDTEFCQRLRAAGHRIVSDPRLRSVHLGDPPTLWALFVGELWRGRGNLRASLRTMRTWRDVASVLIPVMDLVLPLLALAAIALAGWPWLSTTVAALGAFAALVGLRAARMLSRRASVWPLDVLRTLTVATIYDLARALALVASVSHTARRRASVA